METRHWRRLRDSLQLLNETWVKGMGNVNGRGDNGNGT